MKTKFFSLIVTETNNNKNVFVWTLVFPLTSHSYRHSLSISLGKQKFPATRSSDLPKLDCHLSVYQSLYPYNTGSTLGSATVGPSLSDLSICEPTALKPTARCLINAWTAGWAHILIQISAKEGRDGTAPNKAKKEKSDSSPCVCRDERRTMCWGVKMGWGPWIPDSQTCNTGRDLHIIYPAASLYKGRNQSLRTQEACSRPCSQLFAALGEGDLDSRANWPTSTPY